MTITADSLLAAVRDASNRAEVTRIDVEGFGVPLYTRRLSLQAMESYTRASEDKDDPFQLARALASGLCDENGMRLFDPNDDVAMDALQAAVGALEWHIPGRIMAAINAANKATAEEADDSGN